MTDQELYKKCRHYGYLSLEYRRKFIGLLPEVARRELWLRKGYTSIYHFAAKLAGISAAQVDEVLRLEGRLQDKPELHIALITGEIGASKLARIASIATPSNASELAKAAKVLSKSTIETMIRDHKAQENKLNSQSGPLPGHVSENKTILRQLTLAKDVANQLIEMQSRGIDLNQELRDFLQLRRQKLQKAKRTLKPTKTLTPKIRRLVTQEQGVNCAKCHKPAQQIHHKKPQALKGSHHPTNLQPLCAEHHALTHLSERLKYFSST